MIIIKPSITEQRVFKHWAAHDTNNNLAIRESLSKLGVQWSLRKLQRKDLGHLNIIYAPDWAFKHGLAMGKGTVVDYSLKNVYKNYLSFIHKKKDNQRAHEILVRQQAIYDGYSPGRIILVTEDNINYVAFEGNRRMVALYGLRCLVGKEVFVGFHPNITETGLYQTEPKDLGQIFHMENYIWHNTSSGQWGEEYDWESPWNAFLNLHGGGREGWTIIRYANIMNPYKLASFK